MIGKCKRLGPYSTWFYLNRFQWRWAEPITALCRSRDQSDRSNGVAQGNCIMVVWQVAGWQEEGWVVGSHYHHDQNYHVRGLSIKLAGWQEEGWVVDSHHHHDQNYHDYHWKGRWSWWKCTMLSVSFFVRSWQDPGGSARASKHQNFTQIHRWSPPFPLMIINWTAFG